MKVTIHQPEHFPYEGFFQKMQAADLFIVLDIVKYNKQNWQNRNKIKTLDGDDKWFTVQVEKNAPNMAIRDVRTNWDSRVKRRTINFVKQNTGFDLTDFYEYEKLVDINMASIKWCMDMMCIKTPVVMASELGDDFGSKSLLNANLVREVGGTHYISGPSGKTYLDLSCFEGIEVSYFEPVVDNYYSMLYNLTR